MKTVLVTGGARGIGRDTVRTFAHHGYAVALHYHQSQAAAQELALELKASGAFVHLFQADLRDEAQVAQMMQAVAEVFGGIGVLVNNAGITQQKLFTDLTREDWDNVFAANVRSMFFTCRAVLPQMIARRDGCMINIASMWGEVGASCEVAYSASKAAVIGLTKALAQEVAPSGVRVNCVSPGMIDTQMNAMLDAQAVEQMVRETPLLRVGSPAEVAQTVYFLSQPQAAYITGQVLGVNGGLVI